RRHVRCREHFHLVRAQRLLTGARVRQGIKALGNLCKQVPLFHRRASNSAFNIPLSAFFSPGLKSVISSLSYRVNSRLPLPRRGSPYRSLRRPPVPSITSPASGFFIRASCRPRKP